MKEQQTSGEATHEDAPQTAGRAYGLHEARRQGNGSPVGEHIRGSDAQGDAGRIKALARELGADSVGICRLDPQWLHPSSSLDRDGGPDAFPWVVVMVVAMDREGFREATGQAMQTATRDGYARMKRVATTLGDSIAGMGYNAVSAGNDKARSVPLAVQAGLGLQGRNGMLVTPEYGPCVRICKVFTDMQLEADSGPGHPLLDTCTCCTRCAEGCPAGAVSSQTKQPVDRWRVDNARCGAYWREVGGSCGGCISSCPLTFQASQS